MKEYEKIIDDWQFNVLNIYNFNKQGSLDNYFEFIKKNHKKIKGDLVEAGVYRGRSLLSTAIYLKKIGSKKKYMLLIHGKDFLKSTNNIQRINLIIGKNYLREN